MWKSPEVAWLVTVILYDLIWELKEFFTYEAAVPGSIFGTYFNIKSNHIYQFRLDELSQLRLSSANHSIQLGRMELLWYDQLLSERICRCNGNMFLIFWGFGSKKCLEMVPNLTQNHKISIYNETGFFINNIFLIQYIDNWERKFCNYHHFHNRLNEHQVYLD